MKVSGQDLQNLDRKFFDFKIAFAGFLGVILTILFTNSNNITLKNKLFLILFLIITILTFISLFFEVWREGQLKEKNFKDFERNTILANIRHSASIHEEFIKYGIQAEEMRSEENKILNKMKEGKTIEEIIVEVGTKFKWKLGMIWWGILFLSIPILFLLFILSSTNLKSEAKFNMSKTLKCHHSHHRPLKN